MTVTLPFTVAATAVRCDCESRRPVWDSTQGTARSASIAPHGDRCAHEPPQASDDAELRPLQRGQEQGGLTVYGFLGQVLLRQLGGDGRFDDGWRDLKEGRGLLRQRLPVSGAVPLARDLLKHVAHAGLSPDQ